VTRLSPFKAFKKAAVAARLPRRGRDTACCEGHLSDNPVKGAKLVAYSVMAGQ
jgi:hypothetical protein